MELQYSHSPRDIHYERPSVPCHCSPFGGTSPAQFSPRGLWGRSGIAVGASQRWSGPWSPARCHFGQLGDIPMEESWIGPWGTGNQWSFHSMKFSSLRLKIQVKFHVPYNHISFSWDGKPCVISRNTCSYAREILSISSRSFSSKPIFLSSDNILTLQLYHWQKFCHKYQPVFYL